MAVNDNIYKPPRVKEIDPRTAGDNKPEDVIALKNETEKARLRRELVQENKLTDQLMQPPPTPEPPFKISGGINLGNIDIQEQNRQQREDAERARKESEEKIAKATLERDTALKALNDANMNHLQATLLSQMESLKQAVASGQNRDFFSELEKIEGAAAKLGFARSDGAVTDSNLQIQLKRLEIDMKREDRKFALEMKKDERMWQLEVKKLDQQARDSEARLNAEQQKMNMLASLPEQFGGAIAKGLLERGKSVESGVSAAPAQAEQQALMLGANEGESGEFTCPKCSTQVIIGATARHAVCSKCRQAFIINRTPVETQEEEQIAAPSRWA